MTKVLLIDDEESIVRVLFISLKSDGYDVLTAYTGEDGIRLFQKETPDIVLTDIKMPGMNGIEVLKAVKESNPDAEVIVITGHGDMDSAIEALQHGASDFINKPIRDDILALSLQRAQEKLAVKRKLKEYTDDLENMVQIATEEIRRKSEFLNKLITSSHDGIVATAENGEIVIFNPAAEEIFGYSRIEVLRKKTLFDLYPPDIAEHFRRALSQERGPKPMNWQEVTIQRKDGISIPTGFSGTLLLEGELVIGTVGFFQDLREIKRLEENLIRSERLAAIGQTVAGLAHYIKNILSGLKGGTYTVNVGLDKQDMIKLKKGWDIIQQNVSRISTLVMELLTYSKDREPEYEKCSPNKIVEDVCALMEATANEHGIEFIRDLDHSIGEGMMDPNTLHRSLLNLVSNAIDACIFDLGSEKRWQISVKTSLKDNAILQCDVTDNGCGMSEETKKNIFSSFFSTKAGRGTGLGLLVSRKLVNEHGGDIVFTSEEGKGSTFTIRLPWKGSRA
ncbi:MAG: response regulator [Deltaproteobacteria bacterium]|nr:response regulator [Deltaproteobacteria bacterium]